MEYLKGLVVVKNLENNISWSDTYCNSALEAGYKVFNPADTDPEQSKILIGDIIPSNILGKKACNIYFLAAADCTKQEHDNIVNTQHTTTVSQADRNLIIGAFPDISPDKISVDGFPISLNILKQIKETHPPKIEKSVCFLGRTDKNKGSEREIITANELRNRGYKVFHLSGGEISIKKDLEELDVRVTENVNGARYLGLLAMMQCIVNVSPRESLFVSGIEASALGIPVLAPDIPNTGIRDWNNPEYFFQPDNSNNIVNLVDNIIGDEAVNININKYDNKNYFSQIYRHVINNSHRDIL